MFGRHEPWPKLSIEQTHVSFQPNLKRRKQKAAPLPQSEPARRVTWSHVVLVASGMLLMFLIESLFWPGSGLVWRQSARESTTQAPHATRVQESPWGPLEYTPIALDRPEEYFAESMTGGVRTAWVFRDHTEHQLTALLHSFQFSASTLAQLTNRAHWEMLPRAIRVWPPAQAIVEMTPETRRDCYQWLARNPENALQAQPFRFRTNGFTDWFANCGLSQEKIDLVRKLTYEDGATLCFADAPTFAQLSTEEETKLLVKCVWRVSTFVMRVRIDEATDVNGLMDYWGRFGADKTYTPLIESMSRVQEGSSINISYFLPPFARLRLYTYPDPRDPSIARQDCFWSAMNFFNTAPDNGFFNPEYTKQVLNKDYLRMRDGSRQFGDLLLLLGRDNEALHMCVYLADDVVFTKNGANTQQPWVLMRISEMLGEYEKNKPFELVVYRRKTPPALGSAVQVSTAAPLL